MSILVNWVAGVWLPHTCPKCRLHNLWRNLSGTVTVDWLAPRTTNQAEIPWLSRTLPVPTTQDLFSLLLVIFYLAAGWAKPVLQDMAGWLDNVLWNYHPIKMFEKGKMPVIYEILKGLWFLLGALEVCSCSMRWTYLDQVVQPLMGWRGSLAVRYLLLLPVAAPCKSCVNSPQILIVLCLHPHIFPKMVTHYWLWEDIWCFLFCANEIIILSWPLYRFDEPKYDAS